MWWRIKDWFTNTGLSIRLWFYVKFRPSKFKNVDNPIEKEGWELTFNDEFDQGKLDRKKWITSAYYGLRFHPGNIIDRDEAPDSYYGDNMFEFEGSIMKQKADNNPKKITWSGWDGSEEPRTYTIPYRIGQIDSSQSFKQMYGYWEIKSKITSEPGSWPAFWMVSTDEYPPEADVYEIYTGKKGGMKSFESNFHWKKNLDGTSEDRDMDPKKHRVLDVSEDFHTYAWEWEKDKMKIYYDNVLVRVCTNPKVIAQFRVPMHIIINNGIHIQQNPEKANYPTYHEVDYVRVYKKKVRL
jgi:beta-glucanase (GH16 family)